MGRTKLLRSTYRTTYLISKGEMRVDAVQQKTLKDYNATVGVMALQ
jgi:hypothetical protein